jgi:hypothetical protein
MLYARGTSGEAGVSLDLECYAQANGVVLSPASLLKDPANRPCLQINISMPKFKKKKEAQHTLVIQDFPDQVKQCQTLFSLARQLEECNRIVQAILLALLSDLIAGKRG